MLSFNRFPCHKWLSISTCECVQIADSQSKQQIVSIKTPDIMNTQCIVRYPRGLVDWMNIAAMRTNPPDHKNRFLGICGISETHSAIAANHRSIVSLGSYRVRIRLHTRKLLI